MKREEKVQVMGEVFAAITRHLVATNLPDDELPVTTSLFIPLMFLEDARDELFALEPHIRLIFIDRVARRSAVFLAGLDIETRPEEAVADEAIGKLMEIFAEELMSLKIAEGIANAIKGSA